VEKRYYDTRTLERALDVYEAHFGLRSSEFYEAHQADDERVATIPRRHRQHWASFYREWEEFRGEDDFAGQVRRQLEPA
jgi:hypothetical protein